MPQASLPAKDATYAVLHEGLLIGMLGFACDAGGLRSIQSSLAEFRLTKKPTNMADSDLIPCRPPPHASPRSSFEHILPSEEHPLAQHQLKYDITTQHPRRRRPFIAPFKLLKVKLQPNSFPTTTPQPEFFHPPTSQANPLSSRTLDNLRLASCSVET